MRRICAWCEGKLNEGEVPSLANAPVSHGICPKCSAKFLSKVKFPIGEFLDRFSQPIVVVDLEGKVATANQQAQRLLGKTLPDIMGFPGGDVFECEHSYLPAGCGQTEHCAGCSIRRTVMECMASGRGRASATALLHQRTPHGTRALRLEISTEKVGEVVLLRLDSMGPN